jgi:hypothetical protein
MERKEVDRKIFEILKQLIINYEAHILFSLLLYNKLNFLLVKGREKAELDCVEKKVTFDSEISLFSSAERSFCVLIKHPFSLQNKV